jgi:N-hydroxyarylamine O-acetyltransferase
VPEDLDLDAYLRRIGFADEPRPDLPTLRALHLAHVTSIPFENLDIQMGLPIRLDLASLQAKLVRRRRGGYCFEQNGLFLAVLRRVGFDVLSCEARVRRGATELLPRTHMMLLVGQEGGRWLCDVGFGADGLIHPLLLDGQPHLQFHRRFRVVEEQDGERLNVLQVLQGGEWTDLYAFKAEARHPVDYEMANHFTSTYPESRFVKTLTAQLVGPEVRRILRNRAYAEIRGEAVEGRELAPEEVIPVLRETFGLDVPEGVRFRAFDS